MTPDDNILNKLTAMRKKYWAVNGTTPKELVIGKDRVMELITSITDFQFFTPEKLYEDDEVGYVYGMRIIKHENDRGLAIR